MDMRLPYLEDMVYNANPRSWYNEGRRAVLKSDIVPKPREEQERIAAMQDFPNTAIAWRYDAFSLRNENSEKVIIVYYRKRAEHEIDN